MSNHLDCRYNSGATDCPAPQFRYRDYYSLRHDWNVTYTELGRTILVIGADGTIEEISVAEMARRVIKDQPFF